MISKKVLRKILIVLWILFAISVPFVSFFGLILAAFTGVKWYVLFLIGILSICIATGLFLFKRKSLFWVKLIILSIGIISFAVFDVRIYYDSKYIPSITIEDNSRYFNIREYFPFREESKIVVLDEESTLKLSKEETPIIDGATALIPVYTSFINAVSSRSEIYYHSYFIADKDEIEGTEETRVPWYYSTTSNAFEELAKGNRDIIFCAQPSEEQKKYAEENDVHFKCTPIGREGFVFFVNEDNPVDNLTLDQVKKIYSGEITNWNQIGGPDVQIKAYQREKGSGSQTALKWMMGDTPIMQPTKEEVIDGMGGIIEVVENYKNRKDAIGFSFRYFTQEMMIDHKIKLLKINGIAPTADNISSGKYPLTSYFYAITTENSKNTEKLIEWILSEQGQKIIEKTGYAKLSAE